MISRMSTVSAALLGLVFSLGACGDDDDGGGTQADLYGVGSVCSTSADCADPLQTCLPFKGGYCGIKDCATDIDCPDASRCVTHTDGVNYCFRVCVDKAECNYNRPVDFASNCSSNIVFADGSKNGKACVPPS